MKLTLTPKGALVIAGIAVVLMIRNGGLGTGWWVPANSVVLILLGGYLVGMLLDFFGEEDATSATRSLQTGAVGMEQRPSEAVSSQPMSRTSAPRTNDEASATNPMSANTLPTWAPDAKADSWKAGYVDALEGREPAPDHSQQEPYYRGYADGLAKRGHE